MVDVTRSQVYVEGNIETRIYNDPSSQKVKRIREIAVRQNGIPMPLYFYLASSFYSIAVRFSSQVIVR